MQAGLREGFSYRFTDAVVRKPGLSVVDGLRAVDRGQPDIKRFTAEHRISSGSRLNIVPT